MLGGSVGNRQQIGGSNPASIFQFPPVIQIVQLNELMSENYP